MVFSGSMVALVTPFKDGKVDWEGLKTTIHTAIRFLDDVIDVNNYPLPEIELLAKGNRRIGLGIMGWAEMLVKLGIPYGSPKSVRTARELMSFVNKTALEASERLAEDRGVFPNWKSSTYDPKGRFFRGVEQKPRHCARTTIAPTGTIGLAAGLQGTGIEPFYENLRENRGIVMSHTSATGAGTDWRDHDPEVETLMEIYQGYRRSYEHAGAPRSGKGGGRPEGFVWRAWEKGLKLGLQSSSDHVSTHVSHGVIYVEELTREAILEGIRARRAYAATDNIYVEFRLNGHFMGEAFETDTRPRIEVKIIGTGPIRKVELIKNNTYIHTQRGAGTELSFTYVDNDASAGESYYYIRVEQEDGELAWASPIWVTYMK
ncbi:MAG: hypothetical protein IH856_15155 [Deltaproteobacteria bacterium]|nr:hypothetical protein [Deltaproteobacteria bacterium]